MSKHRALSRGAVEYICIVTAYCFLHLAGEYLKRELFISTLQMTPLTKYLHYQSWRTSTTPWHLWTVWTCLSEQQQQWLLNIPAKQKSATKMRTLMQFIILYVYTIFLNCLNMPLRATTTMAAKQPCKIKSATKMRTLMQFIILYFCKLLFSWFCT